MTEDNSTTTPKQQEWLGKQSPEYLADRAQRLEAMDTKARKVSLLVERQFASFEDQAQADAYLNDAIVILEHQMGVSS